MQAPAVFHASRPTTWCHGMSCEPKVLSTSVPNQRWSGDLTGSDHDRQQQRSLERAHNARGGEVRSLCAQDLSPLWGGRLASPWRVVRHGSHAKIASAVRGSRASPGPEALRVRYNGTTCSKLPRVKAGGLRMAFRLNCSAKDPSWAAYHVVHFPVWDEKVNPPLHCSSCASPKRH